MTEGRIELKNKDGNVCFYCEYNKQEDWIYNCWTGSISDEIVRRGGEINLSQIEKYGVKGILNDNRELTGNWSESNDWIENEYMPKAVALGLKYIAHVFSPKFITKFSAVDLGTRDLPILFRMFGDMEEAKEWLRGRIQFDKSGLV